MEVACGEHGDYIEKLVVAVDDGKCNTFLQYAAECQKTPSLNLISNDIVKQTPPFKPILSSEPLPNGFPKPGVPANCTTSLLESAENLPHSDKTGFPTSGFQQFWILLKRTVFIIVRDRMLTRMRLVSHFIIGILLGLLFYDIGDDAAKVQSNTGCIFFTVMFTMFTAMMPTILTCKSEEILFVNSPNYSETHIFKLHKNDHF